MYIYIYIYVYIIIVYINSIQAIIRKIWWVWFMAGVRPRKPWRGQQNRELRNLLVAQEFTSSAITITITIIIIIIIIVITISIITTIILTATKIPVYMRNLLGWLGTRLAQNTLNCLEIVLITLYSKKAQAMLR